MDAFPRLAILVAGSAALVADDDQAPALFEEALSLPTADQWPFDVARVRLAYGERLRRTRATIESRVPLDMALTTFQKLGAVPWAIPCRAGTPRRAGQDVISASAWSR